MLTLHRRSSSEASVWGKRGGMQRHMKASSFAWFLTTGNLTVS